MLTEGQEILEGRFKIIKKLGSGAFGEIYKGMKYKSDKFLIVEKKKTGEFYAAKIVSNSLENNFNASENGLLTPLFYRRKQPSIRDMLCCFGRANLFINSEAKVSFTFSYSSSYFLACVPGLYYVGTDTA